MTTTSLDQTDKEQLGLTRAKHGVGAAQDTVSLLKVLGRGVFSTSDGALSLSHWPTQMDALSTCSLSSTWPNSPQTEWQEGRDHNEPEGKRELWVKQVNVPGW